MKNKLFLTLTYCLVILGFFVGIASISFFYEEAEWHNPFISLLLFGLILFIAAYFILIALVHFENRKYFIINCVIITVIFLLSYCLPFIGLFGHFVGNIFQMQ